MSVATQTRAEAAPVAATEDAGARLTSWLLRVAVVGVAAGMAVIVGADGAPGWQFVRVAAVAGIAVAVLVAQSRGPAGWRAATFYVVGLLAAATGAGVGVYHALKVGVSLMSIAGLLCLVGGLLLVINGGWTLVRRTPRWGRIPVVATLVVAAFVVLWSLGQAVAATNVPPTSIGTASPADHGMAYQDVEFTTRDGVTLSGWYIPSRSGAAVVLLHGSGSTRADVLDHAVVLARHGYGVMLYDARGHGRSGGRAMEFGWYGDADIDAAITLLQAQPEIDAGRIAAVGMSMGGEQALGAAAGDERITAVVAEGVGQRIAADKAWLSERYGSRGWLQQRIDSLTYALADLLTDAEQPIALRSAAGATAPRQVLLITAGTVTDEGQAAEWIRSAAPDTVQVWSVAEAAHTGGLQTAPLAWERQVTTFLDEALR